MSTRKMYQQILQNLKYCESSITNIELQFIRTIVINGYNRVSSNADDFCPIFTINVDPPFTSALAVKQPSVDRIKYSITYLCKPLYGIY